MFFFQNYDTKQYIEHYVYRNMTTCIICQEKTEEKICSLNCFIQRLRNLKIDEATIENIILRSEKEQYQL